VVIELWAVEAFVLRLLLLLVLRKKFLLYFFTLLSVISLHMRYPVRNLPIHYFFFTYFILTFSSF
jgi:hypothetical protein